MTAENFIDERKSTKKERTKKSEKFSEQIEMSKMIYFSFLREFLDHVESASSEKG